MMCGAGAGAATVQESDCAASWTALSTSFLSTCSSLATFFCAFSPAFSNGVLNRRLAHDHQGGLAGVDGVAELLHVGARHPLPQVAADTADGRTDDGRADDGGREQDADQCARPGTAPGAVAGRRLVLVDVDLALVVLGDHRGVVGADGAHGVEVLDDVVVGAGVDLAGVRPDVDEDAVCLRHGNAPFSAHGTTGAPHTPGGATLPGGSRACVGPLVTFPSRRPVPGSGMIPPGASAPGHRDRAAGDAAPDRRHRRTDGHPARACSSPTEPTWPKSASTPSRPWRTGRRPATSS